MDLARKIARRYVASLVSPEILEALIESPKVSPAAKNGLRRLLFELERRMEDPFPMSDLPAYLMRRKVPEAEAKAVGKWKMPKRKGPSWYDTWRKLEQATKKSITYEAALGQDPDARKAVEAWIKGFGKLHPTARRYFDRLVKRIRLSYPRGSEDASWQYDGSLILTIKKPPYLSAATLAGFITHEVGHAVEEAERVEMSRPPWGEPPFASEYAEFRPLVEDFAESFRVYLQSPATLKRVSPQKFEAMKAIVS